MELRVSSLLYNLPSFKKKGETGANVLVGIQVPEQEMEEFKNRAKALGYDYFLVSDDDYFKLLMH